MPQYTLPDFVTIAIDGGAASGKSTTARALADSLNLMHVDTGSHYRALTLRLLEANTPAEDEAARQACSELLLESELCGNHALIKVAGTTPEADALRSEAVNKNVSAFAALPSVRKHLFNYQRAQRDVARTLGFAGLVMEGRDIGSVIFPDADLRVFLEADEATRSARRAAEGQSDSIAQRDKLDSSRKTAPLKCPEGALKINTGAHRVQEVVDLIAQVLT